jgi:hypothetical protein
MFLSVEHRRSLLPPALFISLYLCALAAIGLHRPCWHDECHFVGTIIQFEQGVTGSTLAHYNEMSMPLPFMLYAAWGKVFGDSLMELRLFSLLVAAITLFAYHSLFFLVTGKGRVSFLLMVFLALNPYMAGASVFVFTDMLMMLSLALFLIGMVRRNGLLLFLSSCAGLLCRQYFAFAVGAGILYFIMARLNERNTHGKLRLAGSLLASTIPLAALFALWHGLSPDNADKSLYIHGGPAFHPNSLTLYITLISVYSLPLLVVFRRIFYRNFRLLIISPVLGLFYRSFPILPSDVAVDANKTTVGYFHRLLRICPGERLEHYVFFALFILALPVCLQTGIDLARDIKQRKTGLPVFLGGAVFSFLAVMPFSYLHWEKYFLPMLPVLALYCVTAQKQIAPTVAPPS